VSSLHASIFRGECGGTQIGFYSKSLSLHTCEGEGKTWIRKEEGLEMKAPEERITVIFYLTK